MGGSGAWKRDDWDRKLQLLEHVELGHCPNHEEEQEIASIKTHLKDKSFMA